MITIDIGRKNTAIAVWNSNGHLEDFDLFAVKNCASLIDKLSRYNPTKCVVEQQMSKNVAASKRQAWIEMYCHMKEIPLSFFKASQKYDQTVSGKSATIRKKWAVTLVKDKIPSHLLAKWMRLPKKDDVADAIIIGFKSSQ